jgi:hypothetical protein
MTSDEAAEDGAKEGGAIATPRKGKGGSETIATFKLNSRFNDKKVSRKNILS